MSYRPNPKIGKYVILIIVKIYKIGFFPLFAAKSVLKQLMKVDTAHRITAKELLDNQWLTVSFNTTAFLKKIWHATIAYFFSSGLIIYI